MKIQNLTPKELGEKVHASESTVAAWCRGEKEPYPVLREPLCMALCCGEDVLFGKENLAFEEAPEKAKPAKEEKPAEPEIRTANTEPAEEPAEVPVAKVKKAPVDKKKVAKPVTPTVSDKEKILAAIREDTILISMMAANNEIGPIEPVAEVGAAAREKGICFHTDAVQAAGAVPINVNEWKADLLSISAHKFYGPKGAGALYVRHGTHIDSLIHGGEQERGLRAGTENVPGIVGLGTAIEAANKELKQNADKMTRLRERLINSILSEIPGTKLNGPREGRLPNNCNISFDKIDGEALLLRLDLAGIAASSGSACTAGSQEISHVLKAIGLTDQEAKGSLRLTTGTGNTEAEIDEAVTVIHEIVNDLRSLFRG